MENLTVPLRQKFRRFNEAYEAERRRLEESGVSASLISTQVWEAPLREVPLSPAELRLYKQLVAMHSVNGGELFGD